MKKFISAFALVAMTLVIFASTPSVTVIDFQDNTTSQEIVKGDLGFGDYDKDPTLDGDKKKKKGKKASKKSCCSSAQGSSAKNCTTTKGTKAAPKSCCPSKGTSAKKPCQSKTE